jgi:hypothetical protein
MAKRKMLCPFSKQLCRECPLYRGRHYYLCFCRDYRGYLENQEEQPEKKSEKNRTSSKFEMLKVLPPSPTWLILNDFLERRKG